MTIKTEWFRTMLRQKELSQRKLAHEMDLEPSAISLMFQGKRKMQILEAEQMARILGVQINEVLLAAGIQSMPRRESSGMQETLRRLMKHATAHAMECTNRGDIASAKGAMDDVSAAMTLLDAMMTGSKLSTDAR